MKANELETIVGYLGKTYAELVVDQIVPEVVLQEIYPGSDRLYICPEEGLGMEFSADEKIFVMFFITLKKTTPSTSPYKGELPDIFFPEMDQEMIIELFGEPIEYRGPVLLPMPIGQTGGWASYLYDGELFPGVELQFQYTADMQVDTLAFILKK